MKFQHSIINMTPLHGAIQFKNAEIVKILLEDQRTNINLKMICTFFLNDILNVFDYKIRSYLHKINQLNILFSFQIKIDEVFISILQISFKSNN